MAPPLEVIRKQAPGVESLESFLDRHELVGPRPRAATGGSTTRLGANAKIVYGAEGRNA